MGEGMQEQLVNLELSKHLLIPVVDLHTQVQNAGILLWDAIYFLVRCFEAHFHRGNVQASAVPLGRVVHGHSLMTDHSF